MSLWLMHKNWILKVKKNWIEEGKLNIPIQLVNKTLKLLPYIHTLCSSPFILSLQREGAGESTKLLLKFKATTNAQISLLLSAMLHKQATCISSTTQLKGQNREAENM